MGRNELEDRVITAFSKINMNGLGLIDCLVSGIENTEKYSIDTTKERLIEIAQEERAEKEAEQAEYEQKIKQERMERMRQEISDRKQKIQHFEGKEKKFWDKIEKIKKLGIEKYGPEVWQIDFISELFNDNFMDASYSEFCYGFYQGMQYEKNQQKKAKELERRG